MYIFRETSRHEGTAENPDHSVKHSKFRQMQSSAVSRENSATKQIVEHSAAAAVGDDDISRLSRKAVNATNALMRIEAKAKPETVMQSQRCGRDPAHDARTVFVGNVALGVNRKVC